MSTVTHHQFEELENTDARLTSAHVVGEHYHYLDLDGDGVPDAVEYLTSVQIEIDDVGTRLTEKVHRLESRIDLDGTPGNVYVDDRLWLPDGHGGGFALDVSRRDCA